MLYVVFRPSASLFLLRSQKKETKEKATPYRLFPDICIIMGRQAKTRYAQTVACRQLPLIMQI